MNLTYNFFLQHLPNQFGQHSIIIKASQSRNRKYLSLGITVKKSAWDNTRKKVKAADPDHFYKNTLIEAYSKRAKELILKAVVNGKFLTLNQFMDGLTGNKSETLNDFCHYVHNKKALMISKQTLLNYDHQLNKLNEFKKGANIHDVDLKFISDYAYWLATKRSNNESTVSKSLAYLRMIMIEAVRENQIEKSPFLNFKIKAVAERSESLTKIQIVELEKLITTERKKISSMEAISLSAFLFSCYTGIAFTDLSLLKYKDIKTITVDENTFYYITNDRIKTGTNYMVPLSPAALKLLNLNYIENAPLFNMFGNQTTNRHLKRVFKKASVKARQISFHLARHTYGTIALNAGSDQKAIMAAMGHKSVKVNDIYSRAQIEYLVKELLTP